ncbi:MAG: hypothetical protein GXO25_06770 [Euryarchaeota archaeon]|nr:hypothetical protein [Euryarchaeota archaeon]
MILDKKLILAIVAIAVVIILVAVFMNTQLGGSGSSSGGGSSGGSGLALTQYSASAGEDSPKLTLTFSSPLTLGYSVKLMNSHFTTVGIWVATDSTPHQIVVINRIAPPNLIGTYYLEVSKYSTVVLNQTLTFQQPSLKIINYKVNENVKGTSAYIDNITLTLSETGDAPFYYTKMTWTLDGNTNVDKLPLEYFIPGQEKTVTVYINKLSTVGEEHTLIVELGYYDMSTLKITLNFKS